MLAIDFGLLLFREFDLDLFNRLALLLLLLLLVVTWIGCKFLDNLINFSFFLSICLFSLSIHKTYSYIFDFNQLLVIAEL